MSRKPLQLWFRGNPPDMISLLRDATSWMVGSEIAVRPGNAACLAWMEERGWIGRRMHYAPAGSWEAYEITDAGIGKLIEWRDREYAKGAYQQRRWYREHSAARVEASP